MNKKEEVKEEQEVSEANKKQVQAWPFDRPGDPDYPQYLRGQAAEVLPGVLSPMMSSLGAGIAERAWRIHMVETLTIIDEPAAPHTFFPVIGGRSYLNLSVSARAEALSLGVRAEDFAEEFAVGQDFMRSENVRAEGDDARAAQMQAVIGGLLAVFPEERLASDRARASAARTEGKASRATMTPGQLLARVRALEPEAAKTMSNVMLVGTMSAICFGVLEQGLSAALGAEAPAMRDLLSGLGDVESAAPARRVTELAALDGDEYRREMERFLDEFGYRGANEFDIAAPSWELVPQSIDRMVEAARHAPVKGDPTAAAADARAKLEADGINDRWPEFAQCLRNAAFYVAAREQAKATYVMVYNEIRLDLIEIGKRLVATGDLTSADQVFLLSFAELQAVADDASGAAKRRLVGAAMLEQRAHHMEELGRLIPPAMVRVGEIPPVDEWELDDAVGDSTLVELRGVAGAAGVARGRVRVVMDVYEDPPPEPGEVLVAPFTDPGWTLMFMAAEAVVVEVGGALSHSVVVARELGIPAVVSVPGCCRALRNGDLIEVDGSAGIVRILERNPTGV